MDATVKEKDVVCVHLWGAEMRFPIGGGHWRSSKICMRCKITWEYPESNPEPETVIGRIRTGGT